MWRLLHYAPATLISHNLISYTVTFQLDNLEILRVHLTRCKSTIINITATHGIMSELCFYLVMFDWVWRGILHPMRYCVCPVWLTWKDDLSLFLKRVKVVSLKPDKTKCFLTWNVYNKETQQILFHLSKLSLVSSMLFDYISSSIGKRYPLFITG